MSNLKRYTLYIINMIDIVSLILSYFIARTIRFGSAPLSSAMQTVYTTLLLVAIIGYVISNILYLYNDDQYLKRSAAREFVASFKMVAYVVIVMVLYMFFAKVSYEYSRIFVAVFSVTFLIIDVILRSIVKAFVIPRYQNSKRAEKIIVVGPYRSIQTVIKRIQKSTDWRIALVGAVVTDKNMKGGTIENIDIISNDTEVLDDLMGMEVDSILLVPVDMNQKAISIWIEAMHKLGKPVHLSIDQYSKSDSYRKLDQLGGNAVVSYHVAMPMAKRQAIFKRFFDLIFSIGLLPIFFVVFIIAWILSLFGKRGSTLIRRVRVGKNGHRFYQYRFRTCRRDANKRVKQKKSAFTIFGIVLKALHLDGLPELVNVLAGDMSFIGPKAPTLSEYLDMSAKERNNLSVNPGIVGYWSTDKDKPKEDIAQSEQDYISDWSPVKDISLVAISIFRYITFQSTKRVTKEEVQEELQLIREYNLARKPLSYNKETYVKNKTFGDYVYLAIKRLLDIVLSLLGIIFLSPILIIIALLVQADGSGSPFYSHPRIGLNGKRINIYKYRSMRMDAGDLEKLLTKEQLAQYKSEFKVDNDPRITKIGSFLRKTSLDELPQLFNILSGNLSIIGPRPIVEEETKIYGNEIAKFLSVKPGLTGYWQAYARNNATYESGERQKMEMYYVDNQSLALDAKIFFKTFSSVISKEGAK